MKPTGQGIVFRELLIGLYLYFIIGFLTLSFYTLYSTYTFFLNRSGGVRKKQGKSVNKK